MEKHDYSNFRNISIEDAISFVSDDSWHDISYFFKQINVLTLEDLFNAYDEGKFNDRRKRYNPNIKGQIELLRAYYLNSPIIANDFLSYSLCTDTKETINKWFTNIFYIKQFVRMGITEREVHILYNYCMEKMIIDLVEI